MTLSPLAVQTNDSGVSHNVQLLDNGIPLGSAQSLTSDGSGTLAVPVPNGLTLTSGDQLTATLDGVVVNIGVVPPGGSLPTGYAASLNVWTGTVSQLPTDLSQITADTLYVLQDTAQDLAAFAASAIQTGVAKSLAASGNLVFNVTGGQLSALQQNLIAENNLQFLNFSPVSIDDTLYGLENVPVLGVNDTLIANDDLAHWIFSASAIEQGYPVPLTSAVLTDNLANLANSINLLIDSSSQTFTTALVSAIENVNSIVVSDSVANYQSEYAAYSAVINGLAADTGKNLSVNYQVTDSLANLEAGSTLLKTSGISFSQINVVDSVANLETAYGNGTLAAGVNQIKQDGLALTITADDTLANLAALLGSQSESGLYAQLQAITINDTAQNILSALQNGVGLNNADNIVITDSYANVLAASQADPALLGQVSQLNLTTGPSNGSGALQIDLTYGNGNYYQTPALPEVVLSYMSGVLTATEISDGNNGTLVSISDAANQTITFDLLGVSDTSGLYAQGGWYHTSGAVSVNEVPYVNAAAYNQAAGTLTLSGSNFTTQAGDYNLTDLSLTGNGVASYALTGGSSVSSASSGSVVIQLSATDQQAVDNLLNNNGVLALDGTNYDLTAKAGWDAGADAIAAEGVTVSNAPAPSLDGLTVSQGQTLEIGASWLASDPLTKSENMVSGSIVDNSGSDSYYVGVTAIADIIVNNATDMNYGVTSATTLNGYSTEYVYGESDGSTFNGYWGYQYVYGVANNTTLNGYDVQYIYNGGVANNTTLTGLNSYEYQYIENGGTANGAVLSGYDSQEYIYSGGTANNTVVNGGTDYVYGTASGTTLNGGTEYVASGGVESSVTVNSGGDLQIASGGLVGAGSVASGGTVEGLYLASGTVDASAIAYDIDGFTVQSGADVGLEIGNGASVTNLIDNGLTETVDSGGQLLSATINNGTDNVYGVASATTLNNYSTENVYGESDGSTFADNPWGYQNVYGVANNTIFNGYEFQTIYSGGVANNTALTGLNGYEYQYIENGGTANGAVLSGYGSQEYIYSGGTANNTVVNGGTDYVYGTASGTTLNGGTEYVASGGVESSVTVNSGGDLQIASGGLVAAGSVASGGTVEGLYLASGTVDASAIAYDIDGFIVQSGADVGLEIGNGASVANLIDNGLTETVDSGGQLLSATINNGTDNIYGVASATTLNNYSTENVYGESDGSTFADNPWGYQNVYGVANNTTFNGYEFQTIYSGGVANNTALTGLNGYEYQYIENGGTANGAVLSGYDSQEYIYSGGTANNTVVNGGTDYVYGTASGTTLNGGTEYVASGGVESSVTVNSGGDLQIASGGLVAAGSVASGGTVEGLYLASGTVDASAIAYDIDGFTVQSGADVGLEIGNGASVANLIDNGLTETVDSGGQLLSATINNGTDNVYGVASATTFNNNSTENVYGESDGSTFNGYWGYQYVYGVANNTTLNGYDVQYIYNGGVANNTALTGLNGYEYQYIENGGTANGAVLSGYGSQEYIYSGGTANNTVVNGGTDYVYGTASGTTLNGGTEYVASGGVESSVTVNSGGDLQIASGGLVAAGSVASGGTVEGLYLASGTVDAGGASYTIDGVSIQSGANVGLEIGNGASVSNLTDNGQAETVDSGGQFISATINIGTDNVYGVASATTFNNNSTENVYGESDGSTFTGNPWGYQNVYGVANNTTLGGFEIQSVYSGGVANNTNLTGNTVESQTVYSGGEANGTTVNGNDWWWYGYDQETVNFGGTANGATLNGGELNLYGIASGTSVNSGGMDYVENGGVDTNATVNNGGTEYVENGGIANGAMIDNGGMNYVENGGIANNITINIGGYADIQNGGVASSAIINGGTLEFAGSAGADQSLDFAGNGGELTMDNAANFAGVISGFGLGDSIDLRNAGSATAVAWSNGTLAVSLANGGTVDLTLPGNYQGAVFEVTSDNQGGTLISDNSPTLSAINYDAASGQLTLSGVNLTTSDGDYTVTDVTLQGAGGVSYTLTAGSSVYGTPTNSSVTIQLSPADYQAINTLLNDNGPQALDGATYALSADAGWDSGALAIIAEGVSVISAVVPSLDGITVSQNQTLEIGTSWQAYDPLTNSNNTVSGSILNTSGINSDYLGETTVVGITLNGGTDYVYGVADGATVNNGGLDIVFSGGLDTNATVNSGGNQWIGTEWYNPIGGPGLSGGVASGATVNSGGTEWIVSGGEAFNTTVNSGGTEWIISGGEAFNTTVNSGGVENIVSGGIVSGGSVVSGGAISGLVMVSGADSTADASGNITIDGVAIQSGATVVSLEVGAGAALTGYIDNEQTITVDSGGTTTNTTMSGGIENVYGVADGTTINWEYTGNYNWIVYPTYYANGWTGFENVYGVVNGTIDNGGQVYVFSNGQANDVMLNGGQEYVENGGVASGTMIANGGVEYVQSGGVENNVTVNSGGELVIAADGVVSGGSVVSGGAISGLVMVSGADSTADASGNITIDGVAIQSGATVVSLEVGAGAALTGYIDNEQTITVDSGGTTTNTTMSGGIENVYGVADGTTINWEYTGNYNWIVYPTYYANGWTGFENVYGVVNGTIDNGGQIYVFSNGQANDVMLNGGQEYVENGGVASGTMIANGGVEYVQSGGVENNVTVNSGGELVIAADGVVSGGSVVSGGAISGLVMVSGADSTADASGNITIDGVAIQSGATVVSLEVGAGAALTGYIDNEQTITVDSGGTTTNTTMSGGIENVYGVADGTTINWEYTGNYNWIVYPTYYANGWTGFENVYGVVNGTIDNGGQIYVFSNGQANDVMLNGGQEYVENGGVASGTMIANGGVEYVQSGGVENNVTVNNAGNEYVENGGIANSTTVNSGGYENIQNGGIANGAIINGGTLEFSGSAGADQSLLFAGNGGELTLDNAANFAGVIFGFGLGDTIDLKNAGLATSIAWSNGTLAVSLANGGTVDLTLPGNYQTAAFEFSSDNQGGTLISANAPTLSAVSYDAATGLVTLSGVNLTTLAGDYNVTDVTLQGAGGVSYTLTTGSAVLGTPSNSSVTIQLSPADYQAINNLLNDNGAQALDGATYALTAGAGWDNGALASPAEGVSVINAIVPSLNGVTLAQNQTLEIGSSWQAYDPLTHSDNTVNGSILITAGSNSYYLNATTVANSIVQNGGSEYVYSGGAAIGVTVSSGGLEVLSGGGITGGVIEGGGTLNGLLLATGALDFNVTSVIDGVTLEFGARIGLEVGAGATIANFQEFGDTVIIDSGAVANSDQINNQNGWGYENVYGVTNNAIIYNDSVENVNSGGIANNTMVNDGGYQYVYSGGAANATVVNFGGVEIISGGTVSGGTVYAGGAIEGLFLASGTVDFNVAPVVDGVTLYNQAKVGLEVGSGAVIANFYEYGDTVTIDRGAVANGDTVNNESGWGYENVYGVTNSATLYVDAQENIYSGGVANDTTVNNGGQQTIYSGGTANAVTVNIGGYVEVLAGGLISGGTVAAGGKLDGLVLARGALDFNVANIDGVSLQNGAMAGLEVASGAVISNFTETGDTVTIDQGAVANNDTVNNEDGLGYENVYGIVNNTTLNDGSKETIYSGGVANATTVLNGAEAIVYHGGLENTLVVSNGGVAVIQGAVSGGTINNGAAEYVENGGVAGGETIYRGGYEYIAAGGAVSGATISGGFIEFAGAAGSDQSVQFSGANDGILQLDDAAQFAASISGFNIGDTIDLRNIGAVSNVAWSNGELQITQANGNTFDLALAGNYQDIPFFYVSDNQGGTQLSIATLISTVNAVGYDASSGILSLSGGNFSTAYNDYHLSDFTLAGFGGHSYALTGGSSIIAGTLTGSAVTIQLSAADQLAVNSLLNQNGAQAGDNSVYNLSLSSGWENQAATANNLAITVSDAATPSLNGITLASGQVLQVATNWQDYNPVTTGYYPAAGSTLNNFGSLGYFAGVNTVADVTIQNGGSEIISAGGEADASQVNVGGSEIVYGVVSGSTVNGGYETVYGVANSITLNSGILSVASGGVAGDSMVSGGYDYVYGVANGTTIGGPSELTISGLANGDTVNNGGVEAIYGVTSGSVINSGGTEIIFSGGVANDTTVNSGGNLVFSGGVANNVFVASGGNEEVLSGGTVYNGTATSGAVLQIDVGGQEVVSNSTVTYVTVNSGGDETITNGDSNYGTVNANGVETVYGGGVTNFVTINYGGTEVVYSGAVTYNDQVYGTEQINVGGVENGGIVYNGGSEIVNGGQVYNLTATDGGIIQINSGGQEFVSNSTVTYVTINEGGNITINNNGILDYGAVNDGGLVTVQTGEANYLDINSGATEVVYSGAVTYNDNVYGTVQINIGGIASGGIVYSGGSEIVNGGTVYNLNAVDGGIIQINNGGQDYVSNSTVNYITINDGGNEVINNNGNAIDGTINSGGYGSVFFGGQTNDYVVNLGGSLTVYSGAVTYNDNIYGTDVVNIGGIASGAIVFSGGTQIVNGGTVYNSTAVGGGIIQINSGGTEVVSNSTVNDLTVNAGGNETINNNGNADNGVINIGGFGSIYFGGVTNNETINYGGSETVYSGAVTYNDNDYGNEYVNIGGIASGAIVHSGGTQIVNGGTVYNSTAEDGGSIQINSGGQEVVSNSTVNNLTVNIGGNEIVNNNGNADNGVINVGGFGSIYVGGVTNNETINVGGSETVYSGAVTYNDNIYGDVYVSVGGIASGAIVYSGGTQIVNGGTVYNSTAVDGGSIQINSGGAEVVSNSTVNNVTINAGGNQIINNFGIGDDGAINVGGFGFIYVGGVTNNETINVGGSETVYSGAVTYNDNIYGEVYVSIGGIASGAIVYSGGTQIVNGGTVYNSTAKDGGNIQINNGGEEVVSNSTVNNVTINAGGNEIVNNYGVADDCDINVGGFGFIYVGGVTNNETINIGGTETVYSGAVTYNDNIYGAVYVDIGGIASGAFVYSGGTQIVNGGTVYNSTAVSGGSIQINSGGEEIVSNSTVNNVTINAGGNEIVNNYGIADDWNINVGGFGIVSAGGQTNNETINIGGTETVYSGAVTYNDNIYGAEYVSVGGVASGAFVYNGGTQIVNGGMVYNSTAFAGGSIQINSGGEEIVSNGTVNNVTINAGGNEIVANGGVADNTMVNTGGYEYIQGGAVSGPLIAGAAVEFTAAETVYNSNNFANIGGVVSGTQIAGGTVEFAGAAGADQSVIFTGGGELILDNPAAFAGVISGFNVGDKIDLVGAGSVSSVVWNQGELLVSLASGGTVDLALAGNFQGDTFTATSDSQGGTLISLQPSVSGVSYNAANGVFTFTGANLNLPGSGIVLGDLTLSGGVSSYTFNSNDTLSNLTANGFTVSLSSTDQETLNAFVNANGASTLSGAAYNLTAASNWDSDSGAAITAQAVIVSGVAATDVPQILQAEGVSKAAAVAVDSSGDVFLVNSSTNSIQEIIAGGTTITTLLSGFHNPVTSIAVDSAGDVFAFDSYHNSIVEVGAGTDTVSTLTSSLYAPMGAGMVTDSKGDVFIAESNAVKEIVAGTHTLTTLATGFIMPQSIAIDSAGDLFVADTGNNAIKEIQAVTHQVTTLVSGLNAPNGIAVDSAGNVYFADTKNGNIDEYAASTHSVSTLAGGLNSPTNLVLDSAGNLYATQSNGGIEEIDHTDYVFNTPLTGSPAIISNLIENTGQIELSAAVFTAFAGESSLAAANFSNAASAASPADFLYYNGGTGGLYYEAEGSSGIAPVEIAVVGVNSHPADLSAGDFKVVA